MLTDIKCLSFQFWYLNQTTILSLIHISNNIQQSNNIHTNLKEFVCQLSYFQLIICEPEIVMKLSILCVYYVHLISYSSAQALTWKAKS